MNRESRGEEESEPTPPILGELDPTSIPGHPGYVPGPDFAEQLATPTEVSHGEAPEEHVVAYSNLAEQERAKARKAREAAFVQGGVGMFTGGTGMFIAQKMQGDLSPHAEAFRTLVEHSSYITAMLGGLVMILSTARAGRHYTRAAKAETAFNEAAQATKNDEA